jgi:2-polyprenyl-6-methoxyphenol hydroxylase-like FAD-dependent oxidoreductase
MNFNRTPLTRMLYDNLPDHDEKVKTNSGLADIEAHENGVRVILENGSVEEGSIVIGCDGVHSKTREIMRRLSRQAPSTSAVIDDEVMVSSFQVLYGRASYVEGLEKHTFFETRGTGMTSQVTAADDSIHFGLFSPLPAPTKERKRFTEDETAEYAKGFFDVAVGRDVKFRDIWPKCTWTQLVYQEEGFMKSWHHDRIVLVGDSVHKMTSNAGMGLNCAIDSMVVLINELNDALNANANPDTPTLDGVFSKYQETRQAEAKSVYDMSAQIVRMTTWSTWMAWFMDQYFVPWVGMDKAIARGISTPIISQGRILNSKPDKGRHGSVPWVR